MNIEELMKDDAFMEQFKATAALEEIVELLRAKGIEVNTDELKAVMRVEEGELDEAELDVVAGGVSVLSWIKSLCNSNNNKGRSSGGGGQGSFGSGGSMSGR